VTVAIRTCPLCEATCGLAVELEGDGVVRVRGDAEDVFSHGFLCPKGVALKELHEDPDRIRTPLIRRRPDDGLAPASWDEAFALIASRAGELVAPFELTDAMMPGVVSLPHGWGHDDEEVRLGVARARAGVNSNILTDESRLDVPSGNAVLGGIPVEVAPVRAAVPAL
jgi:anaerobic selenocysteine-containing dehydrogenase